MSNYKQMYLHLARETEQAVRIIQQAQLDCEEMCINSPAPGLTVLDKPPIVDGDT